MNEVLDFLRRYPPFRDLDSLDLERLVSEVGTESYPAGSLILQQSSAPAHHLYVVRRGAVDLLDEGTIVDRLGEGEVFGISVLSGLGPALSVRAQLPTECLLIEAARARELLGTQAGLAFLAATAARWRQRASFERHAGRAAAVEALVVRIGDANDEEELATIATGIGPAVGSMLDERVDPVDIGHAVGSVLDRLTMRLIELYLQAAGDPPSAFAWLALGSAARHEQSVNTDQDHALAAGDLEREGSAYFAGMADAVTSGLAACGIARCSGGVMAENPAWRRTTEGWRARFGEYVADPSAMGPRVAGIAFDFRRVAGPLQVERELAEVIRVARDDRAFMRRLANTVLDLRAPISRRLDIAVERGGEHAGTLNVKHAGITPITNLARFWAIQAGLTENRTIERLRGAAALGRISDRLEDDLEESFRLLWGIRLEHHVTQVEQGVQPDDHVEPGSLRPIPRRSLGEALRVIDAAQSTLRAREGRLRGRRVRAPVRTGCYACYASPSGV